MKKFRVLGAALAVAAIALAVGPAAAGPPVEAFVGYAQFRSASLSPTGKYIAGVRREAVGDVLVVIDWETKAVKAIQYARADQQQEIGFVTWKDDNRLIFSVTQRVHVVPNSGASAQRARGPVDDAFITPSRVYASNADGSNLVALYNPTGDIPREVSPSVADVLPNDPDHIILIAPAVTGTQLTKVDISTGRGEVIESGNRTTGRYVTDVNGVAVLRQELVAGGRAFAWERRAPGVNRWTEIARFQGASGANSGVDFLGLARAQQPGQVYVLARPPGKDTTGIYRYDTASGGFQEVLSVPGFDVTDEVSNAAIINTDGSLFAVCYWERRFKCNLSDPHMQRHYNAMQQFIGADNTLIIQDTSDDHKRWLLYSRGPRDLGTYFVYNTETRQADVLTQQRPGVEPEQLPTVQIVDYKSRDGTPLWGYLWIPPGAENAHNLPLIVHPHGGPEGRDLYGFAAGGWPQYWAANGYLVFQPNFRGGGGFGREFVKAGWRQWGQRMQQDVRDGAEAIIASGAADRNRVCIAGWSYGGYATMTGALVDGDLYKCASAGAGVSDLLEMLAFERRGNEERDVGNAGGGGAQSISYKYWTTAIGEPGPDHDMLLRYSAARNADKINIPLQLIHGDEDTTVPYEQSVLMRDAMVRAGKQVDFITLPDTAHSPPPILADQQRTILVRTLAFFQQHLGPGWTAPTN